MTDYFPEWVVVFPGKMGLSWKLASGPYESGAAAEEIAGRNSNAVAVPKQLFDKMKEHERRMVQAERTLQECQTMRVMVSTSRPIAARTDVVPRPNQW